MKLILSILFLTLIGPVARAETYYMCGCTNLARGAPGFKNRANWLYERARTLSAAKQRRDKTCFARFGRRKPLWGGELSGPSRERRERSDYARRRQDSINDAGRALDEVIRRNREDEIDRVLKEARECRMYGNCPGR
jgi:hypothetical protein